MAAVVIIQGTIATIASMTVGYLWHSELMFARRSIDAQLWVVSVKFVSLNSQQVVVELHGSRSGDE